MKKILVSYYMLLIIIKNIQFKNIIIPSKFLNKNIEFKLLYI